MKTRSVDVAIIGGGPAGLSAALSARMNGIEDILVIERGESLGGILNQCIHEGFGLHTFNETLTGPEYMQRYIDRLEQEGIAYLTDSMVLDISPEKEILVNNHSGLQKIQAKAIVLSMGCRERTRGQICTPGERPAGIYTAGTAQYLMNLEGYRMGDKAVIIGSGDIGLIMARRLTWEGAKVQAVLEIMPYSAGLPRNMVQCLEDFDIPLYLGHTVTEIHGKKRVEAVTIAKVDERWKPVKGTERKIECDTVLLSVGLIPENELSKSAGIEMDPVTSGAIVDEDFQSTVEGIFACGNVLHVHDLVDFVSMEGEKAGRSAAEYVRGTFAKKELKNTRAGEGVRYVMPQRFSGTKDVEFAMRVMAPERDVKLVISDGERVLKTLSKPRVNPAEMIHVKLKKEDLEGCNELVFSCGDM